MPSSFEETKAFLTHTIAMLGSVRDAMPAADYNRLLTAAREGKLELWRNDMGHMARAIGTSDRVSSANKEEYRNREEALMAGLYDWDRLCRKFEKHGSDDEPAEPYEGGHEFFQATAGVEHSIQDLKDFVNGAYRSGPGVSDIAGEFGRGFTRRLAAVTEQFKEHPWQAIGITAAGIAVSLIPVVGPAVGYAILAGSIAHIGYQTGSAIGHGIRNGDWIAAAGQAGEAGADASMMAAMAAFGMSLRFNGIRAGVKSPKTSVVTVGGEVSTLAPRLAGPQTAGQRAWVDLVKSWGPPRMQSGVSYEDAKALVILGRQVGIKREMRLHIDLNPKRGEVGRQNIPHVNLPDGWGFTGRSHYIRIIESTLPPGLRTNVPGGVTLIPAPGPSRWTA